MGDFVGGEFGQGFAGKVGLAEAGTAFAGSVEELAQEMFGFAGLEPGGDGVDAIEVASELFEAETFCLKDFAMLFEDFGGEVVELDGYWEKEFLTGAGSIVAVAKDFFEADTFAGGLQVEYDEATGRLEEDEILLEAAEQPPRF